YGLWVLRCFIGRFYGAIVTSILSGQCRKVRFHSIVHIFFNSFTYIFPHWFTLLEVMRKAYKKCRYTNNFKLPISYILMLPLTYYCIPSKKYYKINPSYGK